MAEYIMIRMPDPLPENFFSIDVNLSVAKDDDDLDKKLNNILQADGKSQATLKKLSWAKNIYMKWLLLNNHLTEFTSTNLNKFVPRFIMEIKKTNGQNYAAKYLFELIISLQQETDRENGFNYNF